MKFNDMERNGGGLLVGFVILLVIVGGICYYYYNSDSQSEKKDYSPIETAQELVDIGENGKYKLMCDIDVSTIAWVPIDQFNGELDGQGFKIVGLNLDNNDSSQYTGMFRILSNDGYVHNISFEDVNISSSQSGAVAGVNEGTIENVSVAGSVGRSNGVSCGGIAGTNKGNISQSQNYAAVNGQENIGGICGLNSGTVQDCVNHGTVSGAYQDSGGIVGYSSGKIMLCENQGAVESSGNRVGGICGSTKEYKYCLTNDSTNRGQVSGSDYVGGCIGLSNSDVSNLQNHGDVQGKANVGGTFGYVYGEFDGCSAPDQRDFTIEGTKNVGGFIGYIGEGGGILGSIKHTVDAIKLNGATVIGSENVGGIVGYGNHIKILNCEFRGTILSKEGSSGKHYGGIIGYMKGNGSIYNCINYATISLDANCIGGILGYWEYVWAESATFSDCTNYGCITTSGSYCAGIVGKLNNNAGIDHCSNEATIHGYDYVDGIGNGGNQRGNSNTGSIIKDKVE